jgi:hypothetical protein
MLGGRTFKKYTSKWRCSENISILHKCGLLYCTVPFSARIRTLTTPVAVCSREVHAQIAHYLKPKYCALSSTLEIEN